MSRNEPSRRSILTGTLAAAGATAIWRPASAQQPGETPQRGGTLFVAADSEPPMLNPAIVASNGVFYVASKVIEPLAEMMADGGLQPRLATQWEAAPDGRSIRFSLRPDVRWHDGKEFTSADVAFSAMQVWKPLQNLGRSVFKKLETVETPDPLTAIFRFSAPTPMQLIGNALPALTSVLPRHLYEGKDIKTNPVNAKPVGTGPFRFVEHKPGEYYRLARNPDYWEEGKPYLDEIVYLVLPDRSATSMALQGNVIQLAAFSAVPLTDLEMMKSTPHMRVITDGYDGITYQLTVEINHRRKELADSRVRRAIAHAIDRNFVVKTIFLGYAKTSTGPIPKFDTRFYTDATAATPFAPAKAENLLDVAGYPRGDNGMRFSLRLLPAPWFEQTRQFGDYLRQALRAIGIDAVIVTNDSAAHTRRVYTDHDFDLAIGSPVYRNDPAISTTVLLEGGIPKGEPFTNQYGYDNPVMDDLIMSARTELDAAKRAEIYKRIQVLAAEDLPFVNVAEFTFITVARDNVHNVADNPRWATSHWANTWQAR